MITSKHLIICETCSNSKHAEEALLVSTANIYTYNYTSIHDTDDTTTTTTTTITTDYY